MKTAENDLVGDKLVRMTITYIDRRTGEEDTKVIEGMTEEIKSDTLVTPPTQVYIRSLGMQRTVDRAYDAGGKCIDAIPSKFYFKTLALYTGDPVLENVQAAINKKE